MTHRIVIDEAKLRDEFEEMLDEIYWQYFYHPPTKMTTPGQVDDRPGLTGIEYIGNIVGG